VLLGRGITILGAAILWFWPPHRARAFPHEWPKNRTREKGALWCVGASLDHLLPIVELNKEFDEFFHDPWRRRLARLEQCPSKDRFGSRDYRSLPGCLHYIVA